MQHFHQNVQQHHLLLSVIYHGCQIGPHHIHCHQLIQRCQGHWRLQPTAFRRPCTEPVLLLLVLGTADTVYSKKNETIKSQKMNKKNQCWKIHMHAATRRWCLAWCLGVTAAAAGRRRRWAADITLLPCPARPQTQANIPHTLLVSSLKGSSNESVCETDYRRHRRSTLVDIRPWPTVVGSGGLLKCSGNRKGSVPAV